MQISNHFSLLNHNTFQVEAYASECITISEKEDVLPALEYCKKENKPVFILNGGSNILFTRNVDKTVLLLEFKGKSIVKEDEYSIWLQVQAGENWDDFVQYTLHNNWGGIENLSLIPGNVGTSPMQNIGAYGVEVKDVITEVEAFSLDTLECKVFTNEECQFGYRDSYFKNEAKGKYLISAVTFQLQKSPHTVNIDYGAIQSELEKTHISSPTIQQVSEAVIAIRKSKLPDPKEVGNAGSFFKNPIISEEKYAALRKVHPEIPSYSAGNKRVKIPAAWLIEQSGWKGKRVGDCGVYDKQALVLVNYGGASGREIFDLSTQIIDSVQQNFGIELEREVNIY